jgi:hypothetical protein
VNDGLSQDCGGGGAVTRNIIGLGRSLLDQLSSHIREGIVELDVLRNGYAVMSDGRGAVLLVKGDIASLGAKGDLDRVRDSIHTLFEGLSRLSVELQLLSHWLLQLSF